jgi:malonyl-CoA O-methyltransferase
LWAPGYDPETPVSLLENQLVEGLDIELTGRRLLDVGCGTGRRLRESGAALAIGADITRAMLVRAPRGAVVAADVAALPLPGWAFDVVWCRLVLGHLESLVDAYHELARVCRAGGTVVVSDFHSDAFHAGHRRTFRDQTGVVHEITHHPHSPGDHLRAARAQGLDLRAREDGSVGPLVRPLYQAAGRLGAYQEQLGLRLVLVLAFDKPSLQ